jgi:ubiquinone/menaquinone biosynthesis C-methylase UbiE
MLQVQKYIQQIGIDEGSIIADFGSGAGLFARYVYNKYKPKKVYAVELHEDLAYSLDQEIKKFKMDTGESKLFSVWGDVEEVGGTRIKENSVDHVLLINTFLLLPWKRNCVLEAKRILKKGGKVLLIDWHNYLGESMSHKNILMHEDFIKYMWQEGGFEVVSKLDKTKYHNVFVLQKK